MGWVVECVIEFWKDNLGAGWDQEDIKGLGGKGMKRDRTGQNRTGLICTQSYLKKNQYATKELEMTSMKFHTSVKWFRIPDLSTIYRVWERGGEVGRMEVERDGVGWGGKGRGEGLGSDREGERRSGVERGEEVRRIEKEGVRERK
jgi:hypothetical protein